MCFGIDSSLISPCTLRRIFLYFVSEIFSSSELYGTVFRLRGYLFPSQRYKGRKRGIKGKKRWEKGQCRSYHKNNPCWKEKCKKNLTIGSACVWLPCVDLAKIFWRSPVTTSRVIVSARHLVRFFLMNSRQILWPTELEDGEKGTEIVTWLCAPKLVLGHRLRIHLLLPLAPPFLFSYSTCRIWTCFAFDRLLPCLTGYHLVFTEFQYEFLLFSLLFSVQPS